MGNIERLEGELESDGTRNDTELMDYEQAEEIDDIHSITSSDELLKEVTAALHEEEQDDTGFDDELPQSSTTFGSPLLRTPANLSYATPSRTQDWLTSQPYIPSSPPPFRPTYHRPYIEPEAPARGQISYSEPKIKVIVGPDPEDPLFNYTQRTFFVPAALLSSNSTFFAAKLAAGNTTIHLPDFTPTMFQYFVDFTHSNIFSLNKNAADFALLPAHVDAWVLGFALGSSVFMAAAMKTLYSIFWRQRKLAQSPITAADVLYVVGQTPPGSSLRALFFDAVTAHWTRFEAFNIGNAMVVDGSGVSWSTVYNHCADFRATLAVGLVVVDKRRGQLLGEIEDYVSGRLQPGVRVREVVNALAEDQ
ncbi:hypothetical protein K491DRAFT_674139 [Lophiostoma macrostomum CBS 122681]|uniref:BTB domain-containing protein n=1 Tax=Lophiostoma macrostomum CBS 122681 TaxID=1314788 RepID=A0A6A6TM57_9PLEO|nr:hypothetical protein K491DRAFT_674139 [Lophiostoma macrostomum CBS 122681]